jgi:hypothetical protein
LLDYYTPMLKNRQENPPAVIDIVLSL